MDGNGRWAVARGLPRTAGHAAGAAAVRRTIEAAAPAGIGVLTLFAFSADNWSRPRPEVDALLALLGDYLDSETARLAAEGVRFSVIGRRDRLPPALLAQIETAEAATAAGARLWLRIAVDYSSREAIAAGALGPAVDLLLRTGGEQRLSDFLLWECAYAELIFLRVMWPDFGADDLQAAVRQFRARDRRFGCIREPAYTSDLRWLD